MVNRMKRILLPFVMIFLTAPLAARADLTHRMTSSTQLTVNGAYTDASRIAVSYTHLTLPTKA